jgi:hypothetical protein
MSTEQSNKSKKIRNKKTYPLVNSISTVTLTESGKYWFNSTWLLLLFSRTVQSLETATAIDNTAKNSSAFYTSRVMTMYKELCSTEDFAYNTWRPHVIWYLAYLMTPVHLYRLILSNGRLIVNDELKMWKEVAAAY